MPQQPCKIPLRGISALNPTDAAHSDPSLRQVTRLMWGLYELGPRLIPLMPKVASGSAPIFKTSGVTPLLTAGCLVNYNCRLAVPTPLPQNVEM